MALPPINEPTYEDYLPRVLARDKTCQRCKATAGVTAVRKDWRKADYMRNLIAVCQDCLTKDEV